MSEVVLRDGDSDDGALQLLTDLDEFSLARFSVVGNYTRYEEATRQSLKDAYYQIVAGCRHRSTKRENHLIWAAPGTGKSYFVQQAAASIPEVRYIEWNLANVGEDELRAGLSRQESVPGPCLCLIDEVDARPDASWPYEALLPYLDANVERGGWFVFVMAGSSGSSIDDMKKAIAARPKGKDLLSRIPQSNEWTIAPITGGDRMLIVLSQLLAAGQEMNRSIGSVEKLALYYVAAAPQLASARQLREFAVRATERGSPDDDRIKYDHLFNAGDPENKAFWLSTPSAVERLGGRFVALLSPSETAPRASIGSPPAAKQQRKRSAEQPPKAGSGVGQPPMRTMAGRDVKISSFLLTDIEGSSRLWERDSDAMRQALGEHDRLLARHIRGHGGQVLTSRGEGDSFFAVFASPAQAVAAAAAIQLALASESWPARVRLRVRMAIHAAQSAGDYRGPGANRCGRLRGCAHGGQVLISEAAATQIGDELPAGASLRDLGRHRLRDMADPERIYQLVVDGLQSDFPPLRAVGAVSSRLPTQLSSFVGRQAELRQIRELVRAKRLVTLHGAGGCGKTRLALEAAGQLIESMPGRVWFVDLAALDDASLLPQTLAGSLGLREEPGQDTLATVVQRLRGDEEVLLLLDNCEHVLASVAELVESLLGDCPNLRVLATSREALNLAGEVVFRVPSLTVPRLDSPLDLPALTKVDAIVLFQDRAAAVRTGFVLTASNALAVAQLCARLDGVPLAIELAAARVKVMTPAEILGRLEDRFRLLVGGSRTAMPRQQTLRATVEWSHNLLDDDERRLFRRFSVFPGTCDLPAIEDVCAGDGLRSDQVLDHLGRLIDKSLVFAIEDADGATRYGCLETLRQYGRERLDESGELPAVQERHLQHYMALAETADADMAAGSQSGWAGQLRTDYDNLREALEWAAGEAGEAFLRLAVGLFWFWSAEGRLSEGRQWLTAALDRPAGDLSQRARALNRLGGLAYLQRDYDAAASAYQESLEHYRAVGDLLGVGRCLNNLGLLSYNRADFEASRGHYEASMKVFDQLGDDRARAIIESNLGLLATELGDLDEARRRLEKTLEVQLRLEDTPRAASTLTNLGLNALRRGDPLEARRRYAESLEAVRQQGDRVTAADCLEGLASVSATEGHVDHALLLAAAATALRDSLGAPRPPVVERRLAGWLAAARLAVGEPAAASLWSDGLLLGLEEAMRLALEEEPAVT